MGNVRPGALMALNIIVPAAALFALGALAEVWANKAKDRIAAAPAKIALAITALVLIDQGTKAFAASYMNASTTIIGGWLGINVTLNTSTTVFNFFGLAFPYWLALLAPPVAFFAYRYFRFYGANSRFAVAFVSLLIAVGLCRFLDGILHGGSIDFIALSGFAIFDLKDIYSFVAICALLRLGLFGFPRKAPFASYFQRELSSLRSFAMRLRLPRRSDKI